jgi:hypothetical protein
MPEQPGERSGAVSRLVGTTIRRTLSIGKIYLIIGTALSLLLTVVLLVTPRAAAAFVTTYPLELPLFAVLGSMGGLMTFTSDRTKGVFEYLIAYGVSPRTLFFNGLVATAAMTGILLGLSLTIGVGTATARGVSLGWGFAMALALYTIPVSIAGALFTSTVGMIWSSLSTPRTGINSPAGIAPMIGIAPVILVLIIAEGAPRSDYYYITAGAATAILAAVVGLLAASARLMGRERFLSPM